MLLRRRRVEIVSKLGLQVGDIVVRNCSFADIRAPYGAYEPAATPWGTAIEVVHTNGMVLRNLTIRNNIAVRLDVFLNGAPGVDGLYLESNTVARCGGNCIGLGGTNMHLASSVFLRDTPEMYVTFWRVFRRARCAVLCCAVLCCVASARPCPHGAPCPHDPRARGHPNYYFWLGTPIMTSGLVLHF